MAVVLVGGLLVGGFEVEVDVGGWEVDVGGLLVTVVLVEGGGGAVPSEGLAEHVLT